MAVYVIAQLTFTDEERYRRYQARFGEVFTASTGRLLCAEETPLVLEGEWSGDKLVMMEFPSKDDAMAFLGSPAYQEISQDREAGATTVSLMVRGL